MNRHVCWQRKAMNKRNLRLQTLQAFRGAEVHIKQESRSAERGGAHLAD